MSTSLEYTPTPLEQMLGITMTRRKVTIGLPAPNTQSDNRFPLTPEAAGLLVERGFIVKLESGAAAAIHYSDLKYQEYGVEIVDRNESLRCDIVIALFPLTSLDARSVHRGALLLSFFRAMVNDSDVLKILLRNHVIALALDLIRDNLGHRPFEDVLDEISGRAAMTLASSILADANRGKGILLGGVAGIVPCEVTIIGSGLDAISAARSALGLGATVRIFDNDVYRLRAVACEFGSSVICSALHPRVLLHALQSADVVIATPLIPHHVISSEAISEMKKGVVAFDLTGSLKPVFHSIPYVNLINSDRMPPQSENQRICYVNPASAVPRTVAMAMSNALLSMLDDIFTCDGFTNALMLNDGLQRAALTFLGKPVNPTVAALLGMRAIDIKLMLQFS